MSQFLIGSLLTQLAETGSMLAQIQVFVCGEACIGPLRRLGAEHAV